MMDQLQGDDAQYQSQLLDYLQKNGRLDWTFYYTFCFSSREY